MEVNNSASTQSTGNDSSKASTSLLSKHWKGENLLQPCYGGGKVCISRDASLFSCIFDSKISLFSADERVSVSPALTDESANHEEISCFCMSYDGTNIVTFSKNMLLRHWDVKSGTCLKSIKGCRMPVNVMDYDRTSTLVATGSTDFVVRVWDIPRGYCTHSFKCHHDMIRFVRFHPNCNRLQLFSGSEDNTLKVFDLVKSSCTSQFTEHLSSPLDISFDCESDIAVTVGRDKVMNIYSLIDMTHRKTVPLMEELEAVVILSAAQSASFLVHSGCSGTKKRKSTSDVSVRIILVGGEFGVIRDGNDISVNCSSLCCIDVDSFEINLETAPMSHSALYSISSLCYLQEKEELVITTSDSRIMKRGDEITRCGNSAARRIPGKQFVGCFDDILDIATVKSLYDGNALTELTLAVASNSAVLHILHESGYTVPLVGHTDIILSVVASPDGSVLVTSSKDCSCRVWDTESRKCIATAMGHTDAVSSVAISQRKYSYDTNSAFFISGGTDKVLKRWRILSGRDKSMLYEGQVPTLTPTHSVRAHDKDINTVALSPNDALVASGSQDSTVKLWNACDLSIVATLSGHKRGVWCVRFSPVDKCLASCSGDRTLKMWSITDFSCLRTFQGHTSSVLTCHFVKHGMQLLSGASDGLVHLWTIRSGECENILDRHSDKVWALASTCTDDCVISTGSDASIVCWLDKSAEEEVSRLEAVETKLLLEQKLANDIKLGRYSEALNTAFELRYPNKILYILKCVIEDCKEESSASDTLEDIVREWSDEKISLAVQYLRDWNTNSRNVNVVHKLLSAIFLTVGAREIIERFPFVDTLVNVSCYSERHFQRLNRLHESLYLLEYATSEIALQSSESAST